PDDQSWHSDRGDEYVSPNVISGISITKAKHAKVRRHSYAKDTKWDGDLPANEGDAPKRDEQPSIEALVGIMYRTGTVERGGP
ncbi:unnamed protein product, partial [Ectocarpus fasciculatus]